MSAAGGLHELQVVDHDQIDLREPAALGVHVRHGEGRVVVDADIRRRQRLRRVRDLAPLLGRELAGQQVFQRHQRRAGQQAHHELLAAHLQREDGHGLAQVQARIEGEVQSHAGLAHAGTPGGKDQLGLVEAEDRAVQIRQACGQAGDLVAGVRGLVELVEYVLHHGGDGQQTAHVPPAAQGVDLLLGDFQRGVRLAGALIDEGVDLVRRLAEPPEQRAVPHDGRVLKDVGRRGRDPHDLRHVALTAFGPDAPHLHLIQHGHRVDGLAVGEHGEHGLIDVAVELRVELVRFQMLQHLGDAARVDEHGADDRLLRRGGVRCFFA